MNEFFLFIFKYVSPVILGAILIWRFWGKTEWIFPALIALFIVSNFDYSFSDDFDPVKFRAEIINLSKMGIDGVAGEFNKRGWGEEIDNNFSIFPKGKGKDYFFKFNREKPGEFLVVFKDSKKYEKLFSSIDSLKQKGRESIKGSQDTIHQLSESCFVEKKGNGYSRDEEGFVLKVSRKKDSVWLQNTKPSEVTKPPNKIKPTQDFSDYHENYVPPPTQNFFKQESQGEKVEDFNKTYMKPKGIPKTNKDNNSKIDLNGLNR